MPPIAEQKSSGTTLRAGVAGAGGGTSLVLLAGALPEGTARAIVMYVAPSASVVLGVLVFYVQVQANRYLQQRLVRRLRGTLEEYLANPHTSEEHKLILRKRLEQVEETITLQEVERIRIIGLIPMATGGADRPEPTSPSG